MSFWYSALPAAGVAGVRGVASRWLLAGVLGALAEKHGKKTRNLPHDHHTDLWIFPPT